MFFKISHLHFSNFKCSFLYTFPFGDSFESESVLTKKIKLSNKNKIKYKCQLQKLTLSNVKEKFIQENDIFKK